MFCLLCIWFVPCSFTFHNYLPFHEACAREEVPDYWYNPETSQTGCVFFTDRESMAHQEYKTTESFNRLLLDNFLQTCESVWYVLSLHLVCKNKVH